MTYERFTTKHLRRFLAQWKRQLAHKEQVIARHEPGTAYHTRALREAESYRSKVAEVERELEGREDK